jgi:tRNA pseudouridine55 synthase
MMDALPSAGRSLAGFLNLLKPPGMTSHDVVAFVRRLLGGGKVGHLGTLDPGAAGVLPLALGGATRTLEFLPPARKAYRAEVTFGIETETLDAAGEVLARRDPGPIAPAVLQAACSAWRGLVMQVPPRVSAIRQSGRRGYDRVRQGEDFELPPRPAEYHAVRLLDLQGAVALLEVDCGPGTYVRALARDLGHELGCGAMLSFLLRTRSGPFFLERAVTLEELRSEGIPAHLIPVGEVLASCGMPAVQVDPLPLGRGLEVPAGLREETGLPEPGTLVRLVEEDGQTLGVGRVLESTPLRVQVLRPLPGGGAP